MNPEVVGQSNNPVNSVHPILIVGIVIFVIPFFNSPLNWNIPGWISSVGIFFILAGAVLTIMKQASER